MHPDWIARLRELAEEFDVVGGGAFETHSLNSPKIQSWVPCPSPEEQGGKAFMPYTGGGNLGCRAAVFRALGGMNEDLRGSEDVDFVWRAQLEGYSFGFLREALVGVRLRQTGRDLWKQGRALGYGSASCSRSIEELVLQGSL